MKKLSLTLSLSLSVSLVKASLQIELVNNIQIFCKTIEVFRKPLNESFKKKVGMVQNNVALIITGAIKETLRDKIYQDVDLKPLADRRYTRKLIFILKIML